MDCFAATILRAMALRIPSRGAPRMPRRDAIVFDLSALGRWRAGAGAAAAALVRVVSISRAMMRPCGPDPRTGARSIHAFDREAAGKRRDHCSPASLAGP
jgi:hypothetical protein